MWNRAFHIFSFGENNSVFGRERPETDFKTIEFRFTQPPKNGTSLSQIALFCFFFCFFTFVTLCTSSQLIATIINHQRNIIKCCPSVNVKKKEAAVATATALAPIIAAAAVMISEAGAALFPRQLTPDLCSMWVVQHSIRPDRHSLQGRVFLLPPWHTLQKA